MTTIQGIYRDRIWTPADRTGHDGLPSGPAHDSGWQSNIVVNQARTALAAFMQGGTTVRGVRVLQVGAGNPAWDRGGPPPPAASTTELVDPIDKREIDPDAIVFLDTTGTSTDTPTTRVQVTVTYEPGEPGDEVELREFGLFGEQEGDLYMIDYVRHPVITKGPDDTLERVVRLSF